MTEKTKYVLELTEKEAQLVIDAVQGQLENPLVSYNPGYQEAAEAVVAALNSVGLSGDDL